jgi:hypothetical protein
MELYFHVPYSFHGVVLIRLMGLCFPIHLYIHFMLEHFVYIFEYVIIRQGPHKSDAGLRWLGFGC